MDAHLELRLRLAPGFIEVLSELPRRCAARGYSREQLDELVATLLDLGLDVEAEAARRDQVIA